MAHQFCKNKSGKISPAWERDDEEFSLPSLDRKGLENYKKLRKEIEDLNSNLMEEKFAILIDENSGPRKIEKNELPEILQKFLKPFPIKYQLGL